jgi:hypothetical protein
LAQSLGEARHRPTHLSAARSGLQEQRLFSRCESEADVVLRVHSKSSSDEWSTMTNFRRQLQLRYGKACVPAHYRGLSGKGPALGITLDQCFGFGTC